MAVVGNFDPLVQAHRQLMERLFLRSRSRSLTSLAIVFHPNPRALLFGPQDWPIYNDIKARIAIIRACGVAAVMLIHFTKKDLDLGAEDLFKLVNLHTHLEEFWLGSRQSLGFGPQGSQNTITKLAKKQHTQVKFLPPSTAEKDSYFARQALASGHVRKAKRLVGFPPIWNRPRSSKIRLPWPPGDYIGVPLDDPLSSNRFPRIPVRLETATSTSVTFEWPDRSIEWLAFVKGPGDK